MTLTGADISHVGPDHMRPRHRSIYEAANLCEAIKVETRTAETEKSREPNIGLGMPEGQAKAKYKGGKYFLGKVKCCKYTIPLFFAVSITRRLVLGDVDFTLCQHQLEYVSAVEVDDAVGVEDATLLSQRCRVLHTPSSTRRRQRLHPGCLSHFKRLLLCYMQRQSEFTNICHFKQLFRIEH
ncbi:hypothetical protein ECG_09370 [Echinococcus granulosus]|nr:hypothetical protein ECG_09370 [Echinococcus granulosus]